MFWIELRWRCSFSWCRLPSMMDFQNHPEQIPVVYLKKKIFTLQRLFVGRPCFHLTLEDDNLTSLPSTSVLHSCEKGLGQKCCVWFASVSITWTFSSVYRWTTFTCSWHAADQTASQTLTQKALNLPFFCVWLCFIFTWSVEEKITKLS